MVSVARDEDEPYVAGDEGIGNGETDRPLRSASRIARSKSVFRVASNASSMLAASAATVDICEGPNR